MGGLVNLERDRSGWAVIHAATELFAGSGLLGDRLQSAYALGSLAHGGFAPAVSDIDLAVLTAHLEADISQIIATACAQVADSHELGERLSVFHAPWLQFADPPEGARFPPIDRYDLVRYGVLVHGADLRDEYGVAPQPDEIRAHAVTSALRRLTPEQLHLDVEQLASELNVHDATKLVLWPVRLQHVCDAGKASGNADAVHHYAGLPDAQHRSLAEAALGWRELSAIPEPEAAVSWISEEIYPLHAEVLRRVAEHPEIPRRSELTDRARLLSQQ